MRRVSAKRAYGQSKVCLGGKVTLFTGRKRKVKKGGQRERGAIADPIPS